MGGQINDPSWLFPSIHSSYFLVLVPWRAFLSRHDKGPLLVHCFQNFIDTRPLSGASLFVKNNWHKPWLCVCRKHTFTTPILDCQQKRIARIVLVTRPDHRQLFLQERQDAVHWRQGASKEKSYQGRCGKEKGGGGGGGDHFQPNQESSQQRGRGKASPQRRSSNKVPSSSLG